MGVRVRGSLTATKSLGECKLTFLAVTADKFPPFRVDTTVLFGKEFARRDHKIDWLLQSEYDCRRSYKTQWCGFTAYVGRTDNGGSRLARLRKHLYSLKHDLGLVRLLRANRYDFVQVKDKFLAALVALAAARYYGARFVYWLSFPFPEASLYRVTVKTARYPALYWLRGQVLTLLLYRIILPRADHVFVQSEQMKEDIKRHGIADAKLTAVPMGVSLNELDILPDSQDAPVDMNSPSIVYVGTLARTRHIDFLVRVLAKVRSQFADTTLYLVGDGDDAEDREIIQREAERLEVPDAVVITGFQPRAKAMAYVSQADVCVSPFLPTPILNSTSPTKLIEYMAMKKAVVANEHPEQRLIIDASGGGLCVPYEEEAFADAVITLLQNPAQTARMGCAGRRYVETYRDYTHIADLVERRYRDIRAVSP